MNNNVNNFDVIITSPKGYDPDVQIHFVMNSENFESTTAVRGSDLTLITGLSRIVERLLSTGLPKQMIEIAVETGIEAWEGKF